MLVGAIDGHAAKIEAEVFAAQGPIAVQRPFRSGTKDLSHHEPAGTRRTNGGYRIADAEVGQSKAPVASARAEVCGRRPETFERLCAEDFALSSALSS